MCIRDRLCAEVGVELDGAEARVPDMNRRRRDHGGGPRLAERHGERRGEARPRSGAVRHERRASDVGAALALFDWDQDGTPEIASSSSADDAIVIQSWSDSKLTRRASYETPAGTRALAFCPPEAGSRPALVAAVGEREVWLVR